MKKKDNAGKTLQDVGLSILLVALFASAMLFASTTDNYLESVLMLAGVFLSVLFACFRVSAMAIVIASLQTVAFIAFKLYQMLALGENVMNISLAWAAIPGVACVGGVLFLNGLKKTALENQVLKQQVEDLVMIDPLTGFYNLRSMFMDIQTQISYAERNNNPITLMVIKVRYGKELRSVLKQKQYEAALIKLAKITYDVVRLEDRVYVIDDEGSLAILLTCDKVGAKSVEKRLRGRVENPESFAEVAQSPIRVEVKIGYLQYKKEEFQRDARLFKERVEEEVEYDL